MESGGRWESVSHQSAVPGRDQGAGALTLLVAARKRTVVDLQSKWLLLRRTLSRACFHSGGDAIYGAARREQSEASSDCASKHPQIARRASAEERTSLPTRLSNTFDLRGARVNKLPRQRQGHSSDDAAKPTRPSTTPYRTDASEATRRIRGKGRVSSSRRKRARQVRSGRRRSSLAPSLRTWMYLLLCQDLILTPAHGQGQYEICSNIRGITPPQISMCEERPDVIIKISEGMDMAKRECRHQFRNNRWNCRTKGNTSMFGPELRLASKEAAFDGAIKSAGVLHSIVTACGRGEINGCSCDPRKSSTRYRRAPNGRGHKRRSPHQVQRDVHLWRWGGCSADMTFGNNYSAKFVNAREIRKNDRSLMNIHNYQVGQRVVNTNLVPKCRCHGVSGSCTMSTCWITLPTFRQVGRILYQKYKTAKKVTVYRDPSNRRALSLVLKQPKGTKTNRPNKPLPRELVYLRSSPSFCEDNNRWGSYGTRGRQCDRNVMSKRNCDHLCCKRGYRTIEYKVEQKCQCRFFWCCTVYCASVCVTPMKNYTCH